MCLRNEKKSLKLSKYWRNQIQRVRLLNIRQAMIIQNSSRKLMKTIKFCWQIETMKFFNILRSSRMQFQMIDKTADHSNEKVKLRRLKFFEIKLAILSYDLLAIKTLKKALNRDRQKKSLLKILRTKQIPEFLIQKFQRFMKLLLRSLNQIRVVNLRMKNISLLKWILKKNLLRKRKMGTKKFRIWFKN